MSRKNLYLLLACLLMTGPALAGPTTSVTRISGYYSGDGGEFTLTPNADLTNLTGQTSPFSSFCLERDEYVATGSTYSVVLNVEAIGGGINYGPVGLGGGDLLDARTAYLYSHFRDGTLAGYGYDYTPGAGRANSAQALQDVIWYLEDEMAMTWSGGSLQNTFYTAAQNAVDTGAWVGLGDVRVLNLYALGHAGDPQYRQQDMLVTVVPAPGAILLGGLGSCLIGWLRKRRML